ncbi:hypothetical protein NL108_005313 [Boleophthalmus pectinirostris]|nr:hypothetical protein NL108_005313 [Boleophthalmus pectinirostris]
MATTTEPAKLSSFQRRFPPTGSDIVQGEEDLNRTLVGECVEEEEEERLVRPSGSNPKIKKTTTTARTTITTISTVTTTTSQTSSEQTKEKLKQESTRSLLFIFGIKMAIHGLHVPTPRKDYRNCQQFLLLLLR